MKVSFRRSPALLVAFLGVSAAAQAQFQLPPQAVLIERRDKKLEEAFVKRADWVTDYDKARKLSEEKGKLIFAYFSRSYAPCPACAQVEGGVLAEKQFAEWTEKVVPFLHLTSYVESDKYQSLLTEKGGSGFPYFVFLDSSGSVISEVMPTSPFQPWSVNAFETAREKGEATVKKRTELAQKAEKGDNDDKKRYLSFLLENSFIGADDARAQLEKLEVGKEERKEFAGRIANVAVPEVLKEIDGQDENSRASAGETFARMAEKGEVPTDDSTIQPFYILMMEFAENRKDAALFETAYNQLHERFGEIPAAKPFFAAKAEVLKTLKKG